MTPGSLALRVCGGLAAACLYQAVTNPFVLAILLGLAGLRFGPAWPLAAFWLLLAWFAAHVPAVAFSRWTASPLTGMPIRTAPRLLWILGNDQDGYLLRAYLHPTWPWWLIAFVECTWRNKLRNLPYWPGLGWLHRPKGTLEQRAWRIGHVLIGVRWRGWMTEIEYFGRERFGDFGPRLDQPAAWGGVTWAFRPWGRL